jgi:aminoglycoside 6'-N-acetyltransferase
VDAIEGPRVRLERVAERHAAALRRLHALPEVRRWWRDPPERWPFDDDEEIGYAVVLPGDDRPRGFVQYGEEPEPDYRHASIDVFLDPAIHGAGYGREVVATLAAHLLDAIACYTAVGFRPVGLMRRYERALDGTWHDALLMDLLAPELARPATQPPR